MQALINNLKSAMEAETMSELRHYMDRANEANEAFRFHSEITKNVRLAFMASQTETIANAKRHIGFAILVYGIVMEQHQAGTLC